MSHFVVGVDGGGTRTRAVALGSAGQVLGRAIGRAALLDSTNIQAVSQAIHQAAEAAAAQSGLSLPAAVLHAGVAGAGRADIRSRLEASLMADGVGERVRVGTDVAAAAQDALGGEAGIVLVAGTGSIAWGRGPDGRQARVGGWGTVLGDEGSGYALGLSALRAVAKASDGRGQGTALTGVILGELDLDAPEKLIAWVQTAGKDRVAALAPSVLGLVGSDRVADAIAVDAALQLAAQAETLADTLAPWGEDGPTIFLAGGVLSPDSPLRPRVVAVLERHGLRASDVVVDGARGAGLLALEMLES